MQVGHREGGQRGSLSEINVTPFVDVMLVLLVIFMITTPMMEQGLDVNLPEVEDAPAVSSSDEPVTLTVQADGTIAIGQTELKNLEKIGPVLKQMLSERKDGSVLLEADREVPYGRVIEVMAAIRRADITRVGMVTQLPRE